MNEPTPEEAAAALRTVHEGKEQVISSALGARWIWIVSGLIVFGYSTAIDLFPAAGTWLGWPLVGCCLLLTLGLRTRVGSTLLGRRVMVSSRSFPLRLSGRLLRVVPIFGIGIIAVLLGLVLHVPHVGIYYGALAGLLHHVPGPQVPAVATAPARQGLS